MTTPLVSVVIPTTKRPHLVIRAVRSVLSQTITDLELIVAIDGPNPETGAVLAAIADPRVRIVQHQTGAGAGAARNLGARHATGKWIGFLDDDDEWLPRKLESQLALAGGRDVVVSCRSRVETPHASYV